MIPSPAAQTAASPYSMLLIMPLQATVIPDGRFTDERMALRGQIK
jgi:hypothetical protein